VVCETGAAIDAADDYVEKLTDRELWKPGEIALLTTKSRHPVHIEMANKDRIGYWKSLWDSEDVFYGTVGGFKGLERPVIILAIDGFHNAEDINDFLYVGMTRARDKLVVIGDSESLAYCKIEN
jgi:superfamily I DNA/RNA helicase